MIAFAERFQAKRAGCRGRPIGATWQGSARLERRRAIANALDIAG